MAVIFPARVEWVEVTLDPENVDPSVAALRELQRSDLIGPEDSLVHIAPASEIITFHRDWSRSLDPKDMPGWMPEAAVEQATAYLHVRGE